MQPEIVKLRTMAHGEFQVPHSKTGEQLYYIRHSIESYCHHWNLAGCTRNIFLYLPRHQDESVFQRLVF